MMHPIRITRFASCGTKPRKISWPLLTDTRGARATQPLDGISRPELAVLIAVSAPTHARTHARARPCARARPREAPTGDPAKCDVAGQLKYKKEDRQDGKPHQAWRFVRRPAADPGKTTPLHRASLHSFHQCSRTSPHV